MKKKKSGIQAIYDLITSRIIEALEANVVPWRMPWSRMLAPANFASKKPYRGINMLLTSALGYRSPYFLSYRQMVELGGRLKDDAKGNSVPIIYWNWRDVETEDGDTRKVPFLRYYRVFNVEHIEGLKVPESQPYPTVTKREFNPIEKAEEVLSGMKSRPKLTIGSAAFYRARTDTVTMPEAGTFDTDQEFYSTLFHELTHSTGHKSRLDRPGVATTTTFGDWQYAKEELIAEMGAAFLSAHCGIENVTIQNSAAYIKGWLRALKNDPRMVIEAAAKAQRATDFVLGISYSNEGTEESRGTEIVEAVIEGEAEDQADNVTDVTPDLVEAANFEAADSPVVVTEVEQPEPVDQPVNDDPFQPQLFPTEIIESPKRKRKQATKARATKKTPKAAAKKETLGARLTKLVNGSRK